MCYDWGCFKISGFNVKNERFDWIKMANKKAEVIFKMLYSTCICLLFLKLHIWMLIPI